MEKIKVINTRSGGTLFHYAHFITDCLFPEVVNELYKYEVVRQKTIHQTLGNFSKIYTEVMQNTNTELLPDEFNALTIPVLNYKMKDSYTKKDFDTFRSFVFARYPIPPDNYPEVILIKRGERINLIDDPLLKSLMVKKINVTTGKERREIVRIDDIEHFLLEKYGDKFKSIYLETIPFEQQVAYFNNASLIVMAHGAGMSNAFFCKEGATMIEVTFRGACYPFFDKITKMNNVKHIKCKNNYNDILKNL
jgi:hypothetical protein